MASKVLKTSKQSTAGNRKYITVTSPQKLETNRKFESGKSQSVIMASYTIGSLSLYDIKKYKGQLWSFIASSGSVMELFKFPDIETF